MKSCEQCLELAIDARAIGDEKSEAAWTIAAQLQLSRERRYPDTNFRTCRQQVTSLLLSLFFFAIIAGAILLIMKGGL